MAVQRNLEMDFATELNRTHRMTIYDAREDLTSTDINQVMDDVVLKNIFNTRYGLLTGKVGARIVSKETTEISL
jgi:hypothetical protein